MYVSFLSDAMMELTKLVEKMFARCGQSIYDFKWTLVVVSFLLNCIFGIGLLSLRLNNDIEHLFVNVNTETKQLEDELLKLYPDRSGWQFVGHDSVKMPLFVVIIVSGKHKENLFDPFYIKEITNLINYIQNITLISEYQGVTSYDDLCALSSNECVISGKTILTKLINHCNDTNTCSLNKSSLVDNNSIAENVGQYTISDDSIVDAKYLKFIFYLRQNTEGLFKDSKLWQKHFVDHMSKFKHDHLDIAYSHSTSLFEEMV